MKFKHLATLALSLCLVAQLNFASAEKNYDEEITLPIGTNFDLEMEEITRYEYDGNYVKAQTVNGKEQFILQKTGDTIINVIMEENGQKSEMRVLVHIVTEQQFNGTTTTEPPKKDTAAATKPAASQQTKAETHAKQKTEAPKADTATKPAATAKADTATKPATPAPAATTETKPAAPAKADTKTEAPSSTAAQQPKADTADTKAPAAKEQAPAPAAKLYGIPVSRPANVTPANTIEASRQKVQNLAFDVLEIVNEERTKAGLTPLTMTKDLMDSANVRVKEIPKRFSHIRPDNTRYFTAMTILGSAQDENIAAGQTTAAAVVKAWMSMPSSRNIIMNPSFREIGVSYFETVGAGYSCYWVQLLRG